MPCHDDTDRFCTLCHGTRMLTDTSTHDYSYGAKTRIPCWSCAPASAPEVIVGAEALMDAACAAMGMTREEWSSITFAEYHGGRA